MSSSIILSVIVMTIIRVKDMIKASKKLIIAAKDFLSILSSFKRNLEIKYLSSDEMPFFEERFFFLNLLIKYIVSRPIKVKINVNKKSTNFSIDTPPSNKKE